MMDEATRARLNARAEIFKALAHPSRLFIVEELAKGERCVCTLAEMVGSDISTVSRRCSRRMRRRDSHSGGQGDRGFF